MDGEEGGENERKGAAEEQEEGENCKVAAK